MTPLSPERLHNIRRLRKARYLWRYWPLFAFTMMQELYPAYTYEQFLADLKPRRRKKKRSRRSPLARYGRYHRIVELLDRYEKTGDLSLAREAERLRSRITEPYRILIRKDGRVAEFYLPATVGYGVVKGVFEKLEQTPSLEAAIALAESLIPQARMGS